MSGSFSEYAAEAILAHAVGKTSWSEPTTFVALCTVVPTSASTGATITEANYTGYVRTATSGVWGSATAATPSVISNSSAITFPACTGGTSTVVALALVDNSTTGAGNLIGWCTCAATVVSSTQTPATIAIGALTLSLTAS